MKMSSGGVLSVPEFIEGVEQISLQSNNKMTVMQIRDRAFK
jgi:hypothetical protein